MTETVDDATLVSARTWQGRQTLEAEVVVRATSGCLYRATVSRDAYDQQSTAVVHTWTSGGWVFLLSRTIRELPGIAQHSYVSREGWQPDALDACHHLLDLAAVMMGENW